jgi:hypothetical protein
MINKFFNFLILFFFSLTFVVFFGLSHIDEEIIVSSLAILVLFLAYSFLRDLLGEFYVKKSNTLYSNFAYFGFLTFISTLNLASFCKSNFIMRKLVLSYFLTLNLFVSLLNKSVSYYNNVFKIVFFNALNLNVGFFFGNLYLTYMNFSKFASFSKVLMLNSEFKTYSFMLTFFKLLKSI